MRRATSVAIGGGVVLMVLLAACGTASGGTASGGTTSGAASHPTVASVVHTAQVTVNGEPETVLTDAKGFTLYFFTPDTASQTACTGACAKAWPPLAATSDTPTSTPALPVKFGVLSGANGKQVTCNGHPLYTFASDMVPGDTKGQDVGGVWFVATPGVAALTDTSSATIHTAKVTVAGSAATVLTDARGMTLYYFTPDTASQVACTSACAKAWPPLTATSNTPTSDHGLPGTLAVLNGADGKQVTYNGHALYTFAGDKAAGDTHGQGLLGKWFVAKPDLAPQS